MPLSTRMERREYDIKISVNGRKIHKVIIDPHYEEKHGDSVNDQIILELVGQLDGQKFEPDAVVPPFTYYVTDDMIHDGKKYRLIWLLEDDALYVGIVNAHRRK